MTDHLKTSLAYSLKSLGHWYNAMGVLIAAVATLNFIHTVVNFGLSLAFNTILQTYRLIVHGAIDWVLFIPHLSIPPWAKDLIFVYFLIGSSFMRARAGEGMYKDSSGKLKDALRILFTKDKRLPGGGYAFGGTSVAVYQSSPSWLKRLADLILWYRVARQYFRRPMVHINPYHGNKQYFESDYKTNKPFLYDRRVVFVVQISAALISAAILLIFNGFLSIPTP